jgi:hypothetical protein
MSDKLEIPPASQTGDDHREIATEAIQETGVDDKSEVAYGLLDRESLHLLQSLSPDNSLRYDRNLRRTGANEAQGEPVHTNDHAAQDRDFNMAIATLSQEDSAQSNPSDRESTTSSNEERSPEQLRKPVEATDTPTGGTSALVPSSSPPKSRQYLNDLRKLLKTYVIVDIPSPARALVDPADQHRDQPIEGIININLSNLFKDIGATLLLVIVKKIN